MGDVIHPRVAVLGPTQLLHPAGSRGRDPRRCLEYAAYVVEHPGAQTAQIADVFCVTAATVRTVMAYLRGWLDAHPGDDLPYLSLAYQGGYSMHDDVRSDWEDFQLLTNPKPQAAAEEHLVRALEFVRGTPFADAYPGEWRWAEQLRIDIARDVRDVAHELTSRALDRNLIDLARWAAGRGLSANPEDEQLLLDRYRTRAPGRRSDGGQPLGEPAARQCPS